MLTARSKTDGGERRWGGGGAALVLPLGEGSTIEAQE